jgi:hypothetical protein
LVSKKTYYLKSASNFSNDLLKHSALLGGEHINFLGKYSFDTRNVPENEELRPLNIGDKRVTDLTPILSEMLAIPL